MIAPIDFLPHVDFGRGRVVPFDRDWLFDSIYLAAREHGHSRWWAEQVTASLVMFLRNETSAQVLTSAEVGDMVRHVLGKIGAEEVADNFCTLPPRMRISLDLLAREAGGGFELAFFERLRGTLSEATNHSFSFIHLSGLRRCVKQLCCRRRWQRRCDELEDEIVRHVREVLSAAETRGPVHLLVT